MCREALEPPQPAAPEPAAASETEAATTEAAPDGEAKSPTKRTVKFAVEDSEPPAQTQSAQVDEVKRQRAEVLLAALTL